MTFPVNGRWTLRSCPRPTLWRITVFCNMIFSWCGPLTKLNNTTARVPPPHFHCEICTVFYLWIFFFFVQCTCYLMRWQWVNGKQWNIIYMSDNLITLVIETIIQSNRGKWFFNVTRVYFNWKSEFSSTRLVCSVVIISFFNGNDLNNHK